LSRNAERVGNGEDREHAEIRGDGVGSHVCKHEKEERRDEREHAGCDKDEAPIEAIGCETGRNREEQLRQKSDQPDERKIEGLMTDCVDLPGDRGVRDRLREPAALPSDEVREKGPLTKELANILQLFNV
jgi:hypothetical protein